MEDQRNAEKVFFHRRPTEESILEAAAEALSRGVHLHGAVLAVSDDLGNAMAQLKQGRARTRGFDVTGNDFFLVSLPSAVKPVPLRQWGPPKAFVMAGPQDQTVLFLTCQDAAVLEHLLGVTALYLRAQLGRVYLTTREVHRSLSSLVREHPGMHLRVRECVSKSLIDDPESAKRVRTNREWTDEDFSTVFEKLAQDGKWLSAVKLRVTTDGRATGRLRRDAGFSCEEGIELFYRTALSALANAVAESSSFFGRRGQSCSPTGRSRPVQIRYPESVFADRRQSERLQRVLGRLSHSSLSVFHPNPYLHAGLVDYTDGSSYDIWVTTQSSVVIVPKRKATVQSMERLCNQICDEFEEGAVTEFE